MSRQASVPTAPVQTKIVVPGGDDRAYELFTQAIGEWWPLAKHGVFGPDAATCVFEAREGGRIFERATDGREAEWGRVLEAVEPSLLRFTWHPGRDESTAQEVTVRFAPMVFGTTVSLEHGGWEKLGDAAREVRGAYESGWPATLECLAARAGKK